MDELQLSNDSNFERDHRIDLLIVMNACSAVTGDGFRHGRYGEPAAQRTIFVWVVYGSTGAPGALRNPVENFYIKAEPEMNQDLQRFWELEELSSRRILSPDETYCEMFEFSHRRDASGRYTVRLPMRPEAAAGLGESHKRVMNIYLNSEKKQSRDCGLRTAYVDFMRAYVELDHMEAVIAEELTELTTCLTKQYARGRRSSG